MAKTIKIVTDSISDLPLQLAQELGITIVPLNVRFGSEVFRDGVDLTTEQFYERLRHSLVLPVTSVPSPGAFATAYDKVAEEADEIMVITVTSRLSGTYEVARESIELMKKKRRVEVIDSKWAVMAQGFLATTAARAANAGASFDEVKEIINRNMKRGDMRAAFDTLEYLKRGGRIGAAQAFLGSALKINPVIGMKDSQVYGVARTRSRAKALDNLVNFALAYKRIEELAIEDATTPEDAEALAERLNAKFPRERIVRTKMGPAIGTHTGPHVIVVSVLGDR